MQMQTGKESTLGRYEILTELGRGAMGIVHKAYDPKINRLVAIKTISFVARDSSERQACRTRFFREAEAAGRLSHPRIVAIFDIGEDLDSLRPFIVMEYVPGRSLDQILSAEGANLPLSTVLTLIQEVAEALDYAHLQGVVHRDVKPSNIIIGEHGHAKIADFGIAQLNVSDSGQPGRTWGTPAYMSPEQFKGEPVDGRSDLFSLGVILYTLLTGHRPFQGNSALTISHRVVNRDPVPATAFNTRLSPELDYVIARAIAKNPAERYQTGMEMALDLQRLRNDLESQSQGNVVLAQGDDKAHRTANSKKESDERAAPVPFSRPQEQLAVAFLTLGALVLVFVGLWRAIPVNAALRYNNIASNPPADTRSMASTPSSAQAVVAPVMAPSRQPPTKRPGRGTYPKDLQPSDSLSADQSRPCQLRIAVAHHFVTANLSVWIDDQPGYSHSLRGAIKKHVVLFKGVEGYLSDVLQLNPGEHYIRVRVLSGDGSYDESGSISETLTAGSDNLLTIDFNKHNRGMRLAFEANKDFGRRP